MVTVMKRLNKTVLSYYTVQCLKGTPMSLT